MTIIQPKTTHALTRFVWLFAGALLILGSFYIYEYNHFVSLRHEVESLERELLSLQNRNSDLRQALYAVLNAPALEALARKKGLVIEKKPDFLNLDALWASAAY